MPNFVTTSLPAYVQTNKDLLVKNFGLLGGGTRSRVSIQTGVKKDAYINILDMAPVLQDGAACSFNAQGTATLTQREIETGAIKVNMDICPMSLNGKYAEYLIRISASGEALPFEEYVVDGLIKEINDKIEKLIWQGDTSSADTDLKWADGWLKIAGAEAGVIDVAVAADTSAFNAIAQVYAALPEETLDKNPEIYVSPSVYREFLMDLVSKNFFHYSGPQADAPMEYFFPGTNVKVVCTKGLAGTSFILGSYPKNLYYGCDMEGDNEDIKIWFSDDDDVFKVKVLWNSGVQFAFPDKVVLATLA